MSLRRVPRIAQNQSGSSLIVSVILLIVLTLIVISVIKSTTVNSRVAGNLQVKKEAEAAAQQAIEAVITSNFQDVPLASTAVISVSNAASSSEVGKYTVAVTKPKCLAVAPIKVLDLNAADPSDVPCYVSSSPPGPGFTGGGNSLCANSQWEIEATAEPASGDDGAKVTMHQGISVRVSSVTTCAP